MRKAVVGLASGKVVNVIEIEEGAKWSPPEGCALMDGGEIGDTWDGKKFIKPEIAEPVPPRDLAKEIDDLKARVDELDKK